jgi:hypothetical protein
LPSTRSYYLEAFPTSSQHSCVTNQVAVDASTTHRPRRHPCHSRRRFLALEAANLPLRPCAALITLHQDTGRADGVGAGMMIPFHALSSGECFVSPRVCRIPRSPKRAWRSRECDERCQRASGLTESVVRWLIRFAAGLGQNGFGNGEVPISMHALELIHTTLLRTLCPCRL